jgi:hypothetical protein
VTRLSFLSHPDGIEFGSPLRHADGVTDLSHLGKLEVRGDVSVLEAEAGEELVRISPRRALLVLERSTAPARERLAGQGYRAYDVTSGLAAIEVEGEELMRRLTELDLDALPAIGSIARGAPALIARRDAHRFRLFVPRELGQFVADVVVDLQQGLAR